MPSRIKKRRICQLYIEDSIWEQVVSYCNYNNLSISDFVRASLIATNYRNWRKQDENFKQDIIWLLEKYTPAELFELFEEIVATKRELEEKNVGKNEH